MNTTNIGNQAESVAAKVLKDKGFKIVDKNWRTKYCEIDIIAAKDKIIYFTEVKYRQSSTCGDGLDAITGKKLEQMTFAAEMWVQANNWPGDYRLLVISASDHPPKIDKIIEV